MPSTASASHAGIGSAPPSLGVGDAERRRADIRSRQMMENFTKATDKLSTSQGDMTELIRSQVLALQSMCEQMKDFQKQQLEAEQARDNLAKEKEEAYQSEWQAMMDAQNFNHMQQLNTIAAGIAKPSMEQQLFRALCDGDMDADLTKAIRKLTKEYEENVRKHIGATEAKVRFTKEVEELRRNEIPKTMRKYKAPFICTEWDDRPEAQEDIVIRVPQGQTYRQIAELTQRPVNGTPLFGDQGGAKED